MIIIITIVMIIIIIIIISDKLEGRSRADHINLSQPLTRTQSAVPIHRNLRAESTEPKGYIYIYIYIFVYVCNVTMCIIVVPMSMETAGRQVGNLES